MTSGLADFHITAIAVPKDNVVVYDTRISILQQTGDWKLCGVLNLTLDEWQRFSAVLQAHEAQTGRLPLEREIPMDCV